MLLRATSDYFLDAHLTASAQQSHARNLHEPSYLGAILLRATASVGGIWWQA